MLPLPWRAGPNWDVLDPVTEPLTGAVLRGLGDAPPRTLGVAVSGGGDSAALLHLLATQSCFGGIALSAATVDHGLREGAAAEAAQVAQLCDSLGIAHTTLRWRGWDGSGNLQDEARRARYGLLADWAKSAGLDAVALGHTLEDQAETVVMRLARRSGVDGLSAMAPRRTREGVVWLRPLLDVRRQDLRAYLAGNSVEWIDDPSNDDPRFERVRIRRALALLDDLGVSAAALSEVSQHMRQAQGALADATARLARDAVRIEAGCVAVDSALLRAAPEEIQRRLWRAVLRWISGAEYAPRRTSLEGLTRAARDGTAGTLGGVALCSRKDKVWAYREYNAVSALRSDAARVWDTRWQVKGSDGAGANAARICALGPNGLKQCDNWRAHGIPRAALLGLPGLWHDDTLVSAPVVKHHPQWHWSLTRSADAFIAQPL
ncbi:tRNA lysidine(34) synthetase TilS [Sulfitobacter sp. HNIBRBA3233]|uniref:tRNA lysidine(34) synthetase TilS n=1 Tax=Sulfitobacter marinivivus TaxID=3158558 RepID=UPI0032E02367